MQEEQPYHQRKVLWALLGLRKACLGSTEASSETVPCLHGRLHHSLRRMASNSLKKEWSMVIMVLPTRMYSLETLQYLISHLGHKDGHINMWCGKEWISDFKQEGNWISASHMGNFTIWRYTRKRNAKSLIFKIFLYTFAKREKCYEKNWIYCFK